MLFRKSSKSEIMNSVSPRGIRLFFDWITLYSHHYIHPPASPFHRSCPIFVNVHGKGVGGRQGKDKPSHNEHRNGSGNV